MARNLAAAGHAVKAYDISAAYHAAATEAGITPCNRLDDAVADAEFAITMLPTGRQVHDIWLGGEGALSKLPPGALVIDSSPSTSARRAPCTMPGASGASPCWTPRCRAASWAPRPAL